MVYYESSNLLLKDSLQLPVTQGIPPPPVTQGIPPPVTQGIPPPVTQGIPPPSNGRHTLSLVHGLICACLLEDDIQVMRAGETVDTTNLACSAGTKKSRCSEQSKLQPPFQPRPVPSGAIGEFQHNCSAYDVHCTVALLPLCTPHLLLSFLSYPLLAS